MGCVGWYCTIEVSVCVLLCLCVSGSVCASVCVKSSLSARAHPTFSQSGYGIRQLAQLAASRLWLRVRSHAPVAAGSNSTAKNSRACGCDVFEFTPQKAAASCLTRPGPPQESASPKGSLKGLDFRCLTHCLRTHFRGQSRNYSTPRPPPAALVPS